MYKLTGKGVGNEHEHARVAVRRAALNKFLLVSVYGALLVHLHQPVVEQGSTVLGCRKLTHFG